MSDAAAFVDDDDDDDEPEFQCTVCFGEAPAEDELCADCIFRLDRGELVECQCGEIHAAPTGMLIPLCICGALIKTGP